MVLMYTILSMMIVSFVSLSCKESELMMLIFLPKKNIRKYLGTKRIEIISGDCMMYVGQLDNKYTHVIETGHYSFSLIGKRCLGRYTAGPNTYVAMFRKGKLTSIIFNDKNDYIASRYVTEFRNNTLVFIGVNLLCKAITTYA